MVEELLVHAGQPLTNMVSPAVAHVEQDAAALRTAACQDLAVVREGPRSRVDSSRRSGW